MTREEAIKVITSNDVFDADLIYEAVSMAIKALEQEPKTGHWKIIPFSNNYGEYRPNKYVCSECGWEIDLCRGLQQDTGHRLFCEHCGAKMKVGD